MSVLETEPFNNDAEQAKSWTEVFTDEPDAAQEVGGVAVSMAEARDQEISAGLGGVVTQEMFNDPAALETVGKIDGQDLVLQYQANVVGMSIN